MAMINIKMDWLPTNVQRNRRLAIAHRVYEKYPDACWSSLVSWACYPDRWAGLGRLAHILNDGRRCKENPGPSGCYCGKYPPKNDGPELPPPF